MKLLPNIPELEAFLSTITRIKPTDQSYKVIIVADKRPAITHKKDNYLIDEQKLWFKESSSFTIESIRNIIKKCLLKKNHLISNSIIDSILLLYTYIPNKINCTSRLEEVFDSIQTVSLSQYFLPRMMLSKNFKDVVFGNFRIGKIDIAKFEYKCKRAFSDYYELYKENLKNRVVIERDYFDVNIVAWQSISYKYKISKDSFSTHLLIYFENISRVLFEEFWGKFVEDQFLQISLGIGYIEPDIFKRALGSDIISIYSNIKAFNKKIGFVVPETYGEFNIAIDINFSSSIDEINKTLIDKYSFNNFIETEIHKTIQSYIKFNSKAYIYLYENKIDEGFLNFVISLDLLLSDKGESVQTVSKRTAVLTYKSFGVPFESQKKLIQKIYDARSKYVHAGEAIDPNHLDILKSICRIILKVLFKIQSLPEYQQKGAFNKWLKKLDFVISSLDVDVSIKEEELVNIGIEKYSISDTYGL